MRNYSKQFPLLFGENINPSYSLILENQFKKYKVFKDEMYKLKCDEILNRRKKLGLAALEKLKNKRVDIRKHYNDSAIIEDVILIKKVYSEHVFGQFLKKKNKNLIKNLVEYSKKFTKALAYFGRESFYANRKKIREQKKNMNLKKKFNKNIIYKKKNVKKKN